MNRAHTPEPAIGPAPGRRGRNWPDSLRIEAEGNWEQRVQRLVAQMEAGLEQKLSVDLSTPPHAETTEALRRMVYALGEPAELKVIYGDATLGAPFPVRALKLPDHLRWRADLAVHVGTLTYRHVDYDDDVDVYLVRDRETRTMTNAEIEACAYERMTEILSDPLLAQEAYVALFHTGLEPLVVGMYRAVVRHLVWGRGKGLAPLVILPVIRTEGTRWVCGRRWA